MEETKLQCFSPQELTGSKLQKVYTSLDSSYHNAYNRFQLLLVYAYAFLLLHGVRIECLHHIRTEMHMHEQTTIGIWCTHCGRKDLNWCTPFRVYSQWTISKQYFMVVWCKNNQCWHLAFSKVASFYVQCSLAIILRWQRVAMEEHLSESVWSELGKISVLKSKGWVWYVVLFWDRPYYWIMKLLLIH